MIWSGSCHCGAVRFEVSAELDELTTCDCSLCVKKNAVMAKVHESALTVLAGEDEQIVSGEIGQGAEAGRPDVRSRKTNPLPEHCIKRSRHDIVRIG